MPKMKTPMVIKSDTFPFKEIILTITREKAIIAGPLSARG
jgi:hypothetical protein